MRISSLPKLKSETFFSLCQRSSKRLNTPKLMIQELESIVDYKKGLHYGKFYCDGLARGEGQTLANSLRRSLIYSLSGIGITYLRFLPDNRRLEISFPKALPRSGKTGNSSLLSKNDETDLGQLRAFSSSSSKPHGFFSMNSEPIHEFSSLPGMRESIQEFLFNIRGIVWIQNPKSPLLSNDSPRLPVRARLSWLDCALEFVSTLSRESSGIQDSNQRKNLQPSQAPVQNPDLFILQAKDFANQLKKKGGPDFQVANPEHYLATFSLSRCEPFFIDWVLTSGNSDFTQTSAGSDFGSTLEIENPSDRPWIATQGQYFPVQKVNYNVIQESGESPQSASAPFSKSNLNPALGLQALTQGSTRLSLNTGLKNLNNQSSMTPVNRRSNQEAVILEIWTNQSISPRLALDQAVNDCIRLFSSLQTAR